MTLNKHHTGPEKPDIHESIRKDLTVERYTQEMKSAQQRAALANDMGQEKPLSAALQGMNEKIENRPPEVILKRMRDVLTKERLQSLEINDVELWPTGGSAILETNKGLREYKGDNEITRMNEINLLIDSTADWTLESGNTGKSFVKMENERLVLNRGLLEEALGYVSAEKRHTNPERKKYFENYKEILLDLIEAVESPRDGYLYAQNYGSVAAKQIVQRHCLNTNNAKEAWKSVGIAALGAVFALNAIGNIQQNKFSVFTFATFGALAVLIDGNYKTDIFAPNSGFTHFCRTSLSRKIAEDIFNLKSTQINAMRKYFKGEAGKKITEDSVEKLSNPKNKNGGTDLARAVPKDIAKIFVGYSAAQAHTNLNNLLKMKTGKQRELTLQFIEATYKDGGQTAAEMSKILSNK